jgi:hypothetical protein
MMTKAAAIAFAALVLAGAPSAQAQTASNERNPSARTAYAQANQQPRPRTRIRVTPRCYYRTQPTIYPVPYDCEAPGPGYVRQCAARLVQEARPSGTVIVPRMNCWWQPG